jgi:hypothetical protein
VSRSAWRGACLVTLLYVAVVVPIVVAQGGDAVWFLKFGRLEPELNDYAREVLGEPDLVVPFFEPHDGPRFWVLARDPLLLHPEETAARLDFPSYRARRILYSAVASPFRIGGEHALVWGMLIVNLLAVFVGTYLTILLAADMHAPLRAALGFAVNPCVIAGVMLDICDAMMVAALVGLVLAVRRERVGVAIAAATVAVCTKEVALGAVVAVAIGAVRWPTIRRVQLAVVPAVALFAWSLYVAIRFGWAGVENDVFRAIPFDGWLYAYRYGWSSQGKWDEMVVALFMLVIAILVIRQWVVHRSVGLWCAMGFVIILPFVAENVVFNPTNSSRALGPAFTFLVLDLYAKGRDVQPWPDLRRGFRFMNSLQRVSS